MKELFTRLTFNSNNWIYPSGHLWSKKNQGKTNIPYENQHGFGHEEWLFNLRYNVEGWQYGYIRGLKSLKGVVDKVHLYTVNIEEGIRRVYYLGLLKNVEGISANWDSKYLKASKVFVRYEEQVYNEILTVNGNAEALYNDPFIPVIRFKDEDADLLTEPIMLREFPLGTYKRFQPYKITRQILNLFESGKAEVSVNKFEFIPGKASQTSRFKKYMNAGSKTIIKKHSEIIDSLEEYLKPKYSIEKKNISIERTRFNGCIADVVTKDSDRSISIFEVKTKIDVRVNLRDAIGQLLDYSAFANNTSIKKLVIVSPCKLNKEGKLFLSHIRNVVKVNIEYYHYEESTGFNVFAN